MPWQIFQTTTTNKQWKIIGNVSGSSRAKMISKAKEIATHLTKARGLLVKTRMATAPHGGNDYVEILAKEPSLFRFEGSAEVHPKFGKKHGDPFTTKVSTVAETLAIAKKQVMRFLVEEFKADPRRTKFTLKRTPHEREHVSLKYTSGSRRTTVR